MDRGSNRSGSEFDVKRLYLERVSMCGGDMNRDSKVSGDGNIEEGGRINNDIGESLRKIEVYMDVGMREEFKKELRKIEDIEKVNEFVNRSANIAKECKEAEISKELQMQKTYVKEMELER